MGQSQHQTLMCQAEWNLHTVASGREGSGEGADAERLVGAMPTDGSAWVPD